MYSTIGAAGLSAKRENPDAVTKLWIDVEDLFAYAGNNPRPSGIQRLAFETYRTLQRQHGDSGLIHFVRHDPARNSFRIVPWSDIAALFSRLSASQPTVVFEQPDVILPHPPGRQFVRRLVYRLPGSLRVSVTRVLLTQSAAFRALGQLAGAVGRELSRGVARLVHRRPVVSHDASVTGCPPGIASTDSFADLAAPGDVLLVLGAPWSHPDYAALARVQRDRRGLRLALLIYDLIPLRCPEWFDRGLVRLFRAWFEKMLPLCDHVFAISRATASDVTAYARERGIALSGPVVPIPIGTGFSSPTSAVIQPRTGRLPPAGSYALIVSMIEARKNHALLFRVWRRMLNEMPSDRVPTLVFAGHVGWLVDDLMHQIANTGYLDGKLMLIEDPSDSEITALYQGCLFTLFPSFFEGWGLPVTESLSFGKPCLISNRTSLPEAGGSLARYFDPDNLHDAYAVVRNAVEDRDGLKQWEARVRQEFKPVPWSATVDALLVGLEHPLAASLTHARRLHASVESSVPATTTEPGES
jgi:glycosyltransferase involved in cell wall biosynthesis